MGYTFFCISKHWSYIKVGNKRRNKGEKGRAKKEREETREQQEGKRRNKIEKRGDYKREEREGTREQEQESCYRIMFTWNTQYLVSRIR